MTCHCRLILLIATFFSVAAGLVRAEGVQGVTRGEIVVGTILDLSGPMAIYGRQTEHGMRMHVAEINQQGGINGRLLRLEVEDSASDGARAASVAQRLAQQKQVFAVLGTLGSNAARASLPVVLQNKVINFLPIASGRGLYEPADPLKVAFMMSTADQLGTALRFLLAHRHYQHVCSVVEESDYGQEVESATEAGITGTPHGSVEHFEYAHGVSDFAAVAQHARSSSCDLIVLGGAVRDAIGVISEIRHEGSAIDFLGTSTLYSSLMHELGGKPVEGMYAVNTVTQPYADDASNLVREWTAQYRQRYAEAPTVYAVYGWVVVDLFAKAAARAGPVLTTSSFNAALESTTFPRDMFGSPEFHISSSDRLGCRKVRLSRITDGKWVAVSTLLDAPD